MSILGDLLTTTQSTIRGLALDGIPSESVIVIPVVTDLPKDLPPEKYPMIGVSPYGAERTNPASGTNLKDDVSYPVLIAIVDTDKGTSTDRLQQRLDWREDILVAFNRKREVYGSVNNVDVYSVDVEPQVIVDQQPWTERNKWVSLLLLRITGRQARTI